MSMELRTGFKKTLLLAGWLLLLFLSSSVVFAASPDEFRMQKIQIGLRGGISWSDFGGSEGENFENNRCSFSVGAFVTVPISSRFGIQTDVTYRRTGDAICMTVLVPDYSDWPDEQYDLEDTEYAIRLDYIGICPLLRYRVLRSGPVQPFLLLGPRMDINVVAEHGILEGYVDIPNAKNIAFGVDFGGMVLFNLETPIFIDIRYSLGLTDVISDPEYVLVRDVLMMPTGPDLDVRNNVISITAGVFIR